MRKRNLTAFEAWVATTISDLLGYEPPQAKEPEHKPAKPKTTPARKAYVSGVYVLLNDGEVMYVGQSANVYSRIAAHMTGAPFEFTEFFVIECERSQLLSVEAKAIHDHNPKWNKIIPAHGGKPYKLTSFG